MRRCQRIVIVTATLILLQCLVVGGVCARELIAITDGSAEQVETILAAVGVLCIGILGTFFWGVRMLLRAAREDSPAMRAYVRQLRGETDPSELVEVLAARMNRIEDVLKPLIEERAMRQAEERAGVRPFDEAG